MKIKMNYLRYFAFVLILALPCQLEAAVPGKGGKSRNAQMEKVTSIVQDQNGNPVRGALITSGEGAVTCLTDAEGRFSILVKSNGNILVEAVGYKDTVISLNALRVPKYIRISAEKYLAYEKDILDRLDGGEEYMRNTTAAVSIMDSEVFRKHPDINISPAFQGRAAGLVVRSGMDKYGNETASFFVRGQHAPGSAAIVVIDGMERSIDDISAEEIGSVEILKDISAKILYGPRAANGVVLINTRRGEAHKRLIRTTLEYGLSPVASVPEFLGAYDYANLYNEARLNDGLAPVYSQSQLEGYRNSEGENDLLYPDVDWYGRFTGKMKSYRKASAEFIGGNQTIRYAIVAAYSGVGGLENVGDRSDINRFNLRGNLDMRINDFITARADVAARIFQRSAGQIAGNDLYGSLSTLRPNEYPLTIAPSVLDLQENPSGVPYFGGSKDNPNNLLDDMQYGGNQSARYVMTQTNLGIDFDFGKFIKGLSAEAYLTFDNYNYVGQAMKKNHATYAVESFLNATGTPDYKTFIVRKLNENDNIAIQEDDTQRRLSARGNIRYAASLGRHELSANLSYRFYQNIGYGNLQDCVTSTATARINWSYDQKLFAELILGAAGSNQLAKRNRWLFTPAISLGYIVSEEPYVKLRASAGRMGYHPDSNYLLYNTTWIYAGDYALGETGSGVAYRTDLSTFGNPDLKWITTSEADFGVETFFFDRRLKINADIFTELRDGGFTGMSSLYSAVIGKYIKSVNYTRIRNTGTDVSIRWADSLCSGDFSYGVGLDFTWARNVVLRDNEVPGIESYRSVIGRPSSAIFGLESEGLFGKDVDLEGHAVQTYGRYTVGDIAYKDQNGDGYVDSRDEIYLGKSFPDASWGLNIDLNYKGFGLHILGTAETGASMMLNNGYFWNNGSDSYSVLALERYHSDNNPSGTLPRLTTSSDGNSYRASSFWLEKADFFRLKNIELSYTLNSAKMNGWFKQFRFHVKATNLFVLSSIRGVDPEMPAAGLTNYPVTKTIAAGLTVTF